MINLQFFSQWEHDFAEFELTNAKKLLASQVTNNLLKQKDILISV